MAFPTHRPRRLRRTPAIRRLVAETTLEARQLVLPVFVREGATEPVPIGSMPGVVQHTRDSLRKAAAEAHGLRVDVLAPTPDVDELVDALADFGAARRAEMVEAGLPVTKPSERKPTSRRRV